MSLSKLSPLNLNILQPKKLNTNNNISLPNSSNNVGGFNKQENNHLVKLENDQVKVTESNAGSTAPLIKLPPLPTLLAPKGVPGLNTLLALSMSSSSSGSLASTSLPRLTNTAAGVGVGGKTTTGSKRGIHTMAKRNARERNRVKLVNQGFQTLKQHIPEKFRCKKMSKVDTLRCALDYIRSLAHMLDLTSVANEEGDLSFNLMEDSTTLSLNTSDEAEDGISEYQRHQFSSILSPTTLALLNSQNSNNENLDIDSNNMYPTNLGVTFGHHHFLIENLTSHAETSFHSINNNDDNNDHENSSSMVMSGNGSKQTSSGTSTSSSRFHNLPIVGQTYNNNNGPQQYRNNNVKIEIKNETTGEEYIMGLPHGEMDESNVENEEERIDGDFHLQQSCSTHSSSASSPPSRPNNNNDSDEMDKTTVGC